MTEGPFFLRTIGVLFALGMFLWWAIDPQEFTAVVTGFLQGVFVAAAVMLGIKVMLGYRPWWMGGKRK